jgi:hypothetical protein
MWEHFFTKLLKYYLVLGKLILIDSDYVTFSVLPLKRGISLEFAFAQLIHVKWIIFLFFKILFVDIAALF